MRRLAVAGAALVFCGCTTPPPPILWGIPPGRTTLEFREDDNMCALLAKGARANYQSASLGVALILAAREDAEARRDYRGCMQARGYQEVVTPREHLVAQEQRTSSRFRRRRSKAHGAAVSD